MDSWEKDFLNYKQPYLGPKLWTYDMPKILRIWLERIDSSLIIDFHKVSIIIQAAGRIYSKRVDECEKQAYELYSRLNINTTPDQPNTDQPPEESQLEPTTSQSQLQPTQPQLQPTQPAPEIVTPKKPPKKKPKMEETPPTVESLQQKLLSKASLCRTLATLNDDLVIDLNYNIETFALLESNKRLCYEWFVQVLETDKGLTEIFIDFWDFNFEFTFNENDLGNVLPETLINHRKKHVLETKMFIFLDIHKAVIAVPGDFLSAQEIRIYVKNFIFNHRLSRNESSELSQKTDEGFESGVQDGFDSAFSNCDEIVGDNSQVTFGDNSHIGDTLNSLSQVTRGDTLNSQPQVTIGDNSDYDTDPDLDELAEGYEENRFFKSEDKRSKKNPFDILKRVLHRRSCFRLPEELMNSSTKEQPHGKKRKKPAPKISQKRQKIILQKFKNSTASFNQIHFDKLSVCTSVNLDNKDHIMFPTNNCLELIENRSVQSLTQMTTSVGDSGFCDRISRTTSLTHDYLLENEVMDLTDFSTSRQLGEPSCVSTPIPRRISDADAQRHLDKIPEGHFLNQLASNWAQYEDQKDERARVLRQNEMALVETDTDCVDVGFDIHQYESDLLQKIPTGQAVSDRGVFSGMSATEVSKNFLALLNLATEGNIQITNQVKHSKSDSFCVTKVREERAHTNIDNHLFD